MFEDTTGNSIECNLVSVATESLNTIDCKVPEHPPPGANDGTC